ncbi:hypothetical protein FACS189487_05970 [Campylobacterota bacterium]|nr:hypothetical protein FACS189487_05970 [Campylobacterota bacterium]
MGVPFSRVGREPLAIRAESGGAILEGGLTLGDLGLVVFDGRLYGKITLACDLCAEDYETAFDEQIKLLISNGEFDAKDADIDEAVIEVDGAIDPKEILEGEIASLQCDYHRCPKCEKE